MDEYHVFRVGDWKFLWPLIHGGWEHNYESVVVYWSLLGDGGASCNLYVVLLDALVEARVELARKRIPCGGDFPPTDRQVLDDVVYKVLFQDYGGAREVAEAIARLVQEAQAQTKA